MHQFGGPTPRRRPREAAGGQQQQPESSSLQALLGMLPILIMVILPIITSIFSGGSSTGATPYMVFDNPSEQYTEGRTTPRFDVKYFVNPNDIASYSQSRLNNLDRTAEQTFLRYLRNECEHEMAKKQRLRDEATGWFYQDPERMAAANALRMHSCERLESLGLIR